MWFYFIRSYTNAQSVAKQLEHVDTHVALARLLVISKRVVPNTNHTYVHFLFPYKRENGSVRVTVCTKEWVHGVLLESNTRNKESKATQAQELAIAKERVAELEADLQVAKAAAEKTALGKSESESNLKNAMDSLELSKAKASQLKAQLKATMQELESVKAQRGVLKMRSEAGYPHRSLSESSSSPAPASKYYKKYNKKKCKHEKRERSESSSSDSEHHKHASTAYSCKRQKAGREHHYV
eukprot:g27924.t1